MKKHSTNPFYKETPKLKKKHSTSTQGSVLLRHLRQPPLPTAPPPAEEGSTRNWSSRARSTSQHQKEAPNIERCHMRHRRRSTQRRIKDIERALALPFWCQQGKEVKRPLIRENLNVIQNTSPRRLMPHLLHQMVHNRTNLGGHSIQIMIKSNQATT